MSVKCFQTSAKLVRTLTATVLIAAAGVTQAQIITTVAGTGTISPGEISSCGSGPATGVNLEYGGNAIAVDNSGNLYIAENNIICKVSASGIITTVAGNGIAGNSGDGGLATSASFSQISGLAFDSTGNMYIGSQSGGIRKIDTGGIVTAVPGFDGRGIWGIALDSTGNLYAALLFENKIIKRDTSGNITTVAGTGSGGYSGDGGVATSATLDYPGGLAFDSGGNLHVADVQNRVVRKIDGNGIITSVPGGTFTSDMGTSRFSSGIAFDGAGNLYISNGGDNTVLKVDTNGVNSTVVGTGVLGFSGDGGPAAGARLFGVSAVAVNSAGVLYISDANNGAVRQVLFSNVAVTAALPNTATVGVPYSGHFTITNNGPGPADSAASFAVTGLTNGLTLGVCNVANLAAGASVTCAVTGTPTAPGSVTAAATLTDTADISTVDNNATATVTIASAPAVIQTATPVPTLSQWGLAWVTLLMLAAGGWVSRRRS